LFSRRRGAVEGYEAPVTESGCVAHARAAAGLGDAATAQSAIASATEARERSHRDELLEIGGEFGFSRATQHFMAGSPDPLDAKTGSPGWSTRNA
jgi:hypothetical protein